MTIFNLHPADVPRKELFDLFARVAREPQEKFFGVLEERHDAVSTAWIGIAGRDIHGFDRRALDVLATRSGDCATNWIGNIGIHTEEAGVAAVEALRDRPGDLACDWVGNIGVLVDGCAAATLDALESRTGKNSAFWKKAVRDKLIRSGGVIPRGVFLPF